MSVDRGHLVAALIIIAIFAVGLVLYFEFAAEYGDGLERTMEEAGVEEGEPVYRAPLDYGDDWASAMIAGVLGFGLTFAGLFTYLKLRAGAGDDPQKKEGR